MAKDTQDTPEKRLDAVRTFIAMEGGFENMISRGTHISDLTERMLLADPATTDLTSLYQLIEISGDMIFNDPPGGISTRQINRTDNEPSIYPDIARDWLTRQTARAAETEGSLEFRADQKPDHLGLAAMKIAMGDEPRLLSEVYAEVTDNKSPLSDEFIKDLARRMMDQYFTEPS